MAQLSCGIVGLPNAGKSTLFNALTRAGAAVAPYPFCTIDPNIGVVSVPDDRLNRVASLVDVTTVIHRTVEYVDVAGLVKDASKGAGRGNQFLDHVRNCHALVHAVRCFHNGDVAHVHGELDPVEDARTVNLELILADLDTVEHALQRLGARGRHLPDAHAEASLLEKLQGHLNQEKPVRTLVLSDAERELAKPLRLLTAKRVLYAANIGEEDIASGLAAPRAAALAAFADAEGSAVIPICAKMEDEIAGLEPEDARVFLDDLEMEEPALQRLVRTTADLLGLICFLTFNEKEARAWTIPAATRAQDAAGVIHTDFAKHFIRAEVTAYDDFATAGGAKGAHEKGLTRTEGRDYLVRDGDVIYFRIGV